MKTLRKTLVALVAVVGLCLTLTACGFTSKDATNMMQADMNVTYLGDFDQKNLDALGFTQAEAEENHLGNLEAEAVYFIYNFLGLEEFPNDDLKDQAMEMYKAVYAKSDFTLADCTKGDDGNFNITVKVKPLDFAQLLYADLETWATGFASQYTEEDFNTMDEDTYYTEMVQSFLDYANTKVDSVGTMEEKSIVVQYGELEQDGDTIYYGMKDEDFGNLDMLIIDYTDNTAG